MVRYLAAMVVAMAAMVAHAQTAATSTAKQPIEIAADNLEVLQAENKAIFTGNVIAKQGPLTVKSDQMVVFYYGSGTEQTTTSGAMGEGIYRIECYGHVVFVRPEETAQGDSAIYNVDTDTIDVMDNVILTRQQNILKGTKLNYNLATGRSILSGGVNAQGGGQRVQGLFIPKSGGQ
jgi:lipopolysaccharide export system protein LptA